MSSGVVDAVCGDRRDRGRLRRDGDPGCRPGEGVETGLVGAAGRHLEALDAHVPACLLSGITTAIRRLPGRILGQALGPALVGTELIARGVAVFPDHPGDRIRGRGRLHGVGEVAGAASGATGELALVGEARPVGRLRGQGDRFTGDRHLDRSGIAGEGIPVAGICRPGASHPDEVITGSRRHSGPDSAGEPGSRVLRGGDVFVPAGRRDGERIGSDEAGGGEAHGEGSASVHGQVAGAGVRGGRYRDGH